MELVGIVRCPVESLFPYGKGRQIDQDAVNRTWKYFEKTERRPLDERNHIQGIVTSSDLRSILSALSLTERALASTIQQKDYPLLSGHRIACLDGKHRLRALTQNRPLSWWVVRLYRVEGNWLRFPFQLSTSPTNRQVLQDQVEYASHEIPYSDAEIYRLVRKYMQNKDKLREKECRARLTPCKHISLKGLLKNIQLVKDLDALDQFPGVTGGLKLGNIHKHLALHIDEQISHYLRHILTVWKDITGNNPQVNAAVDLETVQCLQFRAPSTSKVDKLAIRRMFTAGTLFRGLKDLDLRDAVRDRVLSVQVIIPSLETFHENMKYISLGAKFLREHFMEPLLDKKRETPTLYQSLGDGWSARDAYYVEVADSRLEVVAGRPTRYGAYKHLFIAALRHFARLTTNHPRQDVRGETMPAFPERSRIRYLAHLAHSWGFDNAKITGILNSESGPPSVPDYVPRPGIPADWRGGIPFTKNYISLQSVAFPPQLDGPADRGRRNPSTLFVMRDIIDAFFDKTNDLTNLDGGQHSLITPIQQHIPSSYEGGGLPDEEDIYSVTDREEDVEMREADLDKSADVMEKDKAVERRSMINVLGPRSRRISKEQPRDRASEDSRRSIPIDENTIFRQGQRSPHFLSEEYLRTTMSNATSHQNPAGGVNERRGRRTRSLESTSRRNTVHSPISTTNSMHSHLLTLREPQAARKDPPAAHTPGVASSTRQSPYVMFRSFLHPRLPLDKESFAQASVSSEFEREYGTEAPRLLAVRPPADVSPENPTTLREPQPARRPQTTISSYADSSVSGNLSGEHAIRQELDGSVSHSELDFSTKSSQPPVTIRVPQVARQPPGSFTQPLTNSESHGKGYNDDEIGTILAEESHQLAASASPVLSTEARTSGSLRASEAPNQDITTDNFQILQAEEHIQMPGASMTSGFHVPDIGSSIAEVLGARHHLQSRTPIHRPQKGTTTRLPRNSPPRRIGPHARERSFRWRPAEASSLAVWPPAKNQAGKGEKPREKRERDSRRSLRTGWPWTGLFSGSLSPTNMTSQPTLAKVDNTTEMGGVSVSTSGDVPSAPIFEPVPPIRTMRPQRRPPRRLQLNQPPHTRLSYRTQASQSQYSQDSRPSEASKHSLSSNYSQYSDVDAPPSKRLRLGD